MVNNYERPGRSAPSRNPTNGSDRSDGPSAGSRTRDYGRFLNKSSAEPSRHSADADRYHESGHHRKRSRSRSRGDRNYRRRSRSRHRDERDDYRRSGYHREEARHSGRDSSRQYHGSSSNSRRYEEESQMNREPLPSVLPLSQWPRKLKVWDVPPVGYESWTPMQAKESGLFSLASHNVPDHNQSIHDRDDDSQNRGKSYRDNFRHRGLPSYVNNIDGASMGFAGLAQSNPAAQSAKHVKQARRVFLGDLPSDRTTHELITDFFNRLIEERSGKSSVSSDRPVLHCQIQNDKSYAVVEFRTAEEATQVVKMDGIIFQGKPIRIRRPREYAEMKSVDILPAFGVESDKKLFVGDLPTYLTEDQVKDLMQSFGRLLNFYLAKDGFGAPKGYAFCEYLNIDDLELAMHGLNGLDLGDRRLIVERASSPRAKTILASEAPSGKSSLMMLLSVRPEDIEVHPVLMIVNIVEALELQHDDDYEDICQDIQQECEKYGPVVSMQIPRPTRGEKVKGIGKVFIEYETNEECKSAVKGLDGRRFNDRVVVISYFPRDRYLAKDFP